MQCRNYVSKKVRIVSTLFSFMKPVRLRLRVMAPALAYYGHWALHSGSSPSGIAPAKAKNSEHIGA